MAGGYSLDSDEISDLNSPWSSGNMPVSALKAVSTARVCLFSHIKPIYRSNNIGLEWRRCIHPSMQAPRLSLLRLGGELQGHEVRPDPILPLKAADDL